MYISQRDIEEVMKEFNWSCSDLATALIEAREENSDKEIKIDELEKELEKSNSEN